MEDVSEQIIKKYCGSVEDRVAACCDKQVAQYLKMNIFSEIKQKCNSKPVVEFMKQYVENLIQLRFQTTKKVNDYNDNNYEKYSYRRADQPTSAFNQLSDEKRN